MSTISDWKPYSMAIGTDLKLKKTELTEYTEEELKKELKRREYERDLKAYNERKKSADSTLKIIDALLYLGQGHVCSDSPTRPPDCSDESPWNYDNCNRCKLWQIKTDGSSEYITHVTIELEHIGKPPVLEANGPGHR